MAKERGDNTENREELLRVEGVKVDIAKVLEKINDPIELERIRRFINYIYIHH